MLRWYTFWFFSQVEMVVGRHEDSDEDLYDEDGDACEVG